MVKSVTVLNDGTLTRTSSVQDLLVMFNEITCKVSAKQWFSTRIRILYN